MAFQHVILALLETGPSHGWQMKGQIEAALGPEYGGLNKGYIYEVIHKMERDGLVTSRVEPQEGMRPDRSVLEVTDTGLDQLTEWLEEPVRRSAGFRDEFVQKVLAASLRGPDTVRQVCRVQRRAAAVRGEGAADAAPRARGRPGRVVHHRGRDPADERRA